MAGTAEISGELAYDLYAHKPLEQYDRAMYRRRNEIERLFRRLKGFRRVFSRFDKLDVMLAAFVLFALIVDALRFSVNTP